jgi:hypothetical protein
MRGFYRIYKGDTLVCEQNNALTIVGRSLILKSLLGLIPSVGGSIAIGVGNAANPALNANKLIDLNTMNFSIGQSPVQLATLNRTDNIDALVFKTTVNDPLKYIRICDISDNVYDTERRGNNNPIIHISKTVDTFVDTPFLKNSKKFRIPPNFLSKGYVEFEVTLAVSSIITSNVRFTDSDFAVSIVIYEEDFEDSNDTLLAPPVTREPPNKYFNNYFPNYNNT